MFIRGIKAKPKQVVLRHLPGFYHATVRQSDVGNGAVYRPSLPLAKSQSRVAARRAHPSGAESSTRGEPCDLDCRP